MITAKALGPVAEYERDRVLRNIEKLESGCWRWVGAKTVRQGYGQVMIAGRNYRAHRVVHELLRGPLNPHLVIDHLCRNPWCVNPDHLDEVTNRENVLRGVSPLAENARKTHCIRGHELAGANLRETRRRGCVERTCRECHRRRRREARAREALASIRGDKVTK